MVGIQPNLKRVFRNFAVIILLTAFIFPFLHIRIDQDALKIFLTLLALTGFSVFLLGMDGNKKFYFYIWRVEFICGIGFFYSGKIC